MDGVYAWSDSQIALAWIKRVLVGGSPLRAEFKRFDKESHQANGDFVQEAKILQTLQSLWSSLRKSVVP